MSLLPTGYSAARVPVYETNIKPDPLNVIQVSDGLTATRTGDSVLLGIGASLQVQSTNSNPGILAINDSNQLSLTSTNQILIAAGDSTLQINSNAPSISIQAQTITDVVFMKAQIPASPQSLSGGGTQQVGPSWVGRFNDITVSGASALSFQFAASGIAAGSLFEFFYNPASTAGSSIVMQYNSTSFATYAYSSGGIWIRVYTPDGTTFYATYY
jgi:hypothetical protein